MCPASISYGRDGPSGGTSDTCYVTILNNGHVRQEVGVALFLGWMMCTAVLLFIAAFGSMLALVWGALAFAVGISILRRPSTATALISAAAAFASAVLVVYLVETSPQQPTTLANYVFPGFLVVLALASLLGCLSWLNANRGTAARP